MKPREMSEFMTHELLYDFEKGLLDSERKASVQEVLQKSEEVQQDLKLIKLGIQYLNILSETQVSLGLIENVKQKVTYWGQVKSLMSYENWPPFVKWTVEAVLVISVVIVISLVVPWGQLKDFVMQTKDTDLILAELPKASTTTSADSVKTGPGDFEDESDTPAAVVANTQTTAKNTSPTQVVNTVAPDTQKAEESKRKGFVYRGVLSIVNADVGTAKLKEKIVELGGRKAGEVELGWRRNQGDYYFHFTVPESKVEVLQEYFKTLGTIKVSKDPHPRIMPDGIVRMIITTEEAQ